MLRLHYYAEWLYYGFWHWMAMRVFDLPVGWTHSPPPGNQPGFWTLKQPFFWIVQQGWVFGCLHTLEERKAMSSNAKAVGLDAAGGQSHTSEGLEG